MSLNGSNVSGTQQISRYLCKVIFVHMVAVTYMVMLWNQNLYHHWHCCLGQRRYFGGHTLGLFHNWSRCYVVSLSQAMEGVHFLRCWRLRIVTQHVLLTWITYCWCCWTSITAQSVPISWDGCQQNFVCRYDLLLSVAVTFECPHSTIYVPLS